MNKPDIDYLEIDRPIWPLVKTLNAVPFITTQSSCSGHLRDYYARPGDFTPDSGHHFLFIGDIIFKVDDAYPNAGQFLDELREVQRRYSFVRFNEHYCGESRCDIEGSQVFVLDSNDLTSSEPIHDTDTIDVMIRKRHQVTTPVGQQRISEYLRVWRDFMVLAHKYEILQDRSPLNKTVRGTPAVEPTKPR